ncbi:MAG TPA: methyltransferase domain-containing protein [Solirubrobacteraceae bacterium]|nr:methyltransferase domain-containing protein [Solirubrobacteraceae bacterium]
MLAAFEGLALFRGLYGATDEAAQARLEELREILEIEESEPRAMPIVDVGEGYGRWASTYDDPGNPLIAAEEPAVWELLDRAMPGRALDAACGTGRHTAHLVKHGHEVTGVDQSEAMLTRARARAPEAHFLQADLRELPFDEDSFDLAVCALALEHFRELADALGELARVVRPGGPVVLSESHPALRAIGGAPFFRDSSGASGVVRTFPHLHGDYLRAFAAVGLTMRDCREVRFGPAEVALQVPAAELYPEAAEGALLGFPAVLVWDLVVSG